MIIILPLTTDLVLRKSLMGKTQNVTKSQYKILIYLFPQEGFSSDAETKLKLGLWWDLFLELCISDISSKVQRIGPLHLGNPKLA